MSGPAIRSGSFAASDEVTNDRRRGTFRVLAEHGEDLWAVCFREIDIPTYQVRARRLTGHGSLPYDVECLLTAFHHI
jgi:hypothetical protein